MRVARTAMCIVGLVLALVLAGCGSTVASQHTMLSNAVSTPIVTTPGVTVNKPPAAMVDPVRLMIPAIGVNTFVESVGVGPDGDMATPKKNPWVDVGWYNLGPHPGERGSAVIDGHLDRPGGSAAVFWRLRDMRVGDDVQVLDSNGKTLHFHVTRIAFYQPQAAPIQDIFGNRGGNYLNLITCAGDWIPSEHQTTLRLVVYTSLV